MPEPLTQEVHEYLRYCPLAVLLADKDADERAFIASEVQLLDEPGQELLTSTDTADTLKSWEGAGFFPATHAAAIAKLIGMVALDDVPASEVPSLLEKIGIDPTRVSSLTENIRNLLAPIFTQRASEEAPAGIKKVPPLTLSGTTPSPQEPQRNIIDLRKPPTP